LLGYVGQICRLLKKRIVKHKNHIRRYAHRLPLLLSINLSFHWDFDWDIAILDEEVHLNKRLLSKMIYIKKTDF